MIGRLAGFSLTLALLLVPLAAQGCGGPTFIIQQYAGPARPAGTISVVRFNGKDGLMWDSLDGEAAEVRVPEDSRLHVEVLPGTHRLGVLNPQAPSVRHVVSFFAEPGRVYRPVFTQPGGAPRIFEVDASSDALLRDVTLVPGAGSGASPASAPARTIEPPPPLTLKPEPEVDAAVTEPPPAEAGAPALALEAGQVR